MLVFIQKFFAESRHEWHDLVRIYGQHANTSRMQNFLQERIHVDLQKLNELVLAAREDSNLHREITYDEIQVFLYNEIMARSGVLIKSRIATLASSLKIGDILKQNDRACLTLRGRRPDVYIARKKIIQLFEEISIGARLMLRYDTSHIDEKLKVESLVSKKLHEACLQSLNMYEPVQCDFAVNDHRALLQGRIDDLDKALKVFREHSPTVLSFPTNGHNCGHSTIVCRLQKEYAVNIRFSGKIKVHVYGYTVAAVQEATLHMMRHVYDNNIENVLQSELLIENTKNYTNSELQTVQDLTTTQIRVIQVPIRGRQFLTVNGLLSDVFRARLELLGLLDVSLNLDWKDDLTMPKASDITKVEKNLNINIELSRQPNQCELTITITGMERNFSDICRAAQQIFYLDSDCLSDCDEE